MTYRDGKIVFRGVAANSGEDGDTFGAANKDASLFR
jgi:hypothetical protein